MSKQTTSRPTFIIRLIPMPGADPAVALRMLLKRLGRADRLKCIGIEIQADNRVAGETDRASRQRPENRP